MKFWFFTHVGKQRNNNEDRLLINEFINLYAVSDGMGGMDAGEKASRKAIKVTEKVLTAVYETAPPPKVSFSGNKNILKSAINVLATAIGEANSAVYKDGLKAGKTRGATLSSLWFPSDVAIVGHAGDSRIYRMRHGRLQQITTDQATGNFLHSAVGLDEKIQVETSVWHRKPGDMYLLCSDGVHQYFSVDQFQEIMNSFPPDKITRFLKKTILNAGASDNLTAILLLDER